MNGNRMAGIFHPAAFPDLERLPGFEQAVDLHKRLRDRVFGRSPALAEITYFEKFMELDKIAVDGKRDLIHAGRAVPF